ncbi:hypothetical protein LZ554_003443 [Drepanopeziza brunnea f. sp. 'monogermtubi']|nr:hypothetical protein LZ554_003443 [Drepanopeziza brunnea f. sp. 'monogermtubi']
MATEGPVHRVESAMVEYGYPRGHLGHLTNEEQAAFRDFKIVCQEKGYYRPATANEVETHDDATLLRFLRARRFVIADALKQFKETDDWRKANQLDTLYETIDLDQYEETRRLYPQWTGRRDRRGIPVYVFEIKHLNSKKMSAYEKAAKATSSKASTDGRTPAKMLRLFALYENLIRFVMPLCTALTDREHPRTPITQSNNIVDISGVGLKQFWNLRAHMQDASTLATAHYPETLDRIFVIGAPSFFPTVWGWIKKWFDPITTSKIFILSHAEMKNTLEAFIDPVNIPVKYGGKLKFEYGDLPLLDPALAKVTKWNEGKNDFPHGPMYWTNKKGQPVEGGEVELEREITAQSVGSIGGKARKVEVCTVTHVLDGNNAVDEVTNGHATPGTINANTAQAVDSDVKLPFPSSDANDEKPKAAAILVPTQAQPEAPIVHPTPAQEVEEGELPVVPASRPEPERFVTALEGYLPTKAGQGAELSRGVEGLGLGEKSGNVDGNVVVTNGNGGVKGPHSTTTANLLDPNLAVGAAGAGVKEGEKA